MTTLTTTTTTTTSASASCCYYSSSFSSSPLTSLTGFVALAAFVALEDLNTELDASINILSLLASYEEFNVDNDIIIERKLLLLPRSA